VGWSQNFISQSYGVALNRLIPAQSSQFCFNVYPNLDSPHDSLSSDVYNRGSIGCFPGPVRSGPASGMRYERRAALSLTLRQAEEFGRKRIGEFRTERRWPCYAHCCLAQGFRDSAQGRFAMQRRDPERKPERGLGPEGAIRERNRGAAQVLP